MTTKIDPDIRIASTEVGGLSIRAYVAAQVMAGFAGNAALHQQSARLHPDEIDAAIRSAADFAVRWADALIASLSGGPAAALPPALPPGPPPEKNSVDF